jgi:glutamate-ammonia-ligase adenylyltransferase
LHRVADLVRSIERRTSYLALLLEYPAALGHLVKLADASPWIASFLAQHPVLLDELLDPRTLYRPPDRDSLGTDIKRRLGQTPADDLEAQIEELCILKSQRAAGGRHRRQRRLPSCASAITSRTSPRSPSTPW